MRTYLLTERIPTLCRLSSADRDFLLGHAQKPLAVVPTERRGWYQLTARGYVGTLLTPRCRLVLCPKLPLTNFCFLLDPLFQEDQAAPGERVLLVDFLADRLAQRMQERLAAGLQHGYAERAERSRYLRGTLDLAAQLRDPLGPRDRLACRFDAFTTDIPCNQIPRTLAERLLPLVGPEVRERLQRILTAFAEVQTAPLQAETCSLLAQDRTLRAYQPLLALCRLLADGLKASDRAGTLLQPAFLLPMERVFETYVSRGLQQTQAEVRLQPRVIVTEKGKHTGELLMQPDVLLCREGQPRVVVDVKWKRLGRVSHGTQDLYQVLAYCTALGIRKGMLVYPGTRGQRLGYRLTHAGIEVEVVKLRVTGPRNVCQQALTHLANRVTGWAQ